MLAVYNFLILLVVTIKRWPQVSEETLEFGVFSRLETIKDQKDF